MSGGNPHCLICVPAHFIVLGKPPQFHLFSILMFEETEVNIKYVFMSVKYQSTVAVDSEERFTSTLLHRHDV